MSLGKGARLAGGETTRLEVDYGERGEQVRVQVAGDLAGPPAGPFERQVREAFVEDLVREIEIDLRTCSYLDVSGAAALLRLQRTARAKGKSLRLKGATGQVRQKLELTGVLPVLALE